ncbi:MAG: type II secretion system protein GspL [Colwellia sp.]|nr:type II secretion system protein GspL [Colwellia sp.]
MAEKLYIRLGSNAQSTVQWLIFNDDEEGIIACGELTQASELIQLTEKAKHREVVTFVPSSDLVLKSLKVPSKSVKAMRLAVPYMLEDELAQDVEELFFAYSDINVNGTDNNCFVAVIEHIQLELWQSWLVNAEIHCKKILPDVLAMPLPNDENTASAIVLGDQVLVRYGQWQGSAVDVNTWTLISQSLAKDQSVDKDDSTQEKPDSSSGEQQKMFTLNAYSKLPESNTGIAINPMPEELPLALLATTLSQDKKQKFNLLQGEFKIKEQRSPAITSWFWAAGFAGVALLLNVGIKGAELIQLNNQQAQLEQQIVTTYKQAFPQTKRVRVSTIRSQLKQKLVGVGGGSIDSGFLAMLSQIQPALAAVPEIKPQTLKFDGKRNEIRMQAFASDYQYFDKLKISLEENKLVVSQGAQNKQGEQISGSFSIGNQNSAKSTKKSRGRS